MPGINYLFIQTESNIVLHVILPLGPVISLRVTVN